MIKKSISLMAVVASTQLFQSMDARADLPPPLCSNPQLTQKENLDAMAQFLQNNQDLLNQLSQHRVSDEEEENFKIFMQSSPQLQGNIFQTPMLQIIHNMSAEPDAVKVANEYFENLIPAIKVYQEQMNNPNDAPFLWDNKMFEHRISERGWRTTDLPQMFRCEQLGRQIQYVMIRNPETRNQALGIELDSNIQ